MSKKRSFKALVALTALFAISWALTGCSSTSTHQSLTPTSHHSNVQTSSTTFKFGTEHNWPGSAKITLGVPTAYTPSASAIAAAEASGYVAGTPVVLFKITLTNEQKYANSAYLDITIKGGMFIADLANPAGDSFDPPATLLKTGQSVTWTEAYSVPDPTAFSALVGPGFGATPVTFTNK